MAEMSFVHLFMLLVVYRAELVVSYPGGAPDQACTNLSPLLGHSNSTVTGSPPYNLTLSANTYSPGDVIQVTLSGLNATHFKGFLIIGRPVNGQSNAGTFAASAGSQTVCSESLGNGVTHTDNSSKTSISFNWTAPSTTVGDLVFHYTVVRGDGVDNAAKQKDYFQDIRSETLKENFVSSFKRNTECGVTRGCYSQCQNSDCNWEVTWKESIDHFDITIKSVVASDNTYFALGFSNTSTMAPASVVSCIVSNNSVTVIASRTSGHSNLALANPKEGIHNESNSFTNGILACSFSRDSISSNSAIFNLTDPWFLITATGNLSTSGLPSRHSRTNRFATATRINLSNSSADYSVPSVAPTTLSVATTTGSPPLPGSFKKNTECGVTRGCYSKCQNSDCDWEVTWKQVGAQYQITITSTVSGDNTYFAFGFSNASAMNPASVVSCQVSSGQVSVKASSNSGYSNTPLANPKEGIHNESNSFTNGILACSFSRDSISSNSAIFNLTDPWYLITAKGPVNKNGISYHSQGRDATPTRINLSNSSTDYTLPWIAPTTPSFTATTGSSSPTIPKDPTCGKTKGCFSRCGDINCDFLLTWERIGDSFKIVMKYLSAGANSFIAFGLSGDGKMSPASVLGCISYGATAGVYASNNVGRGNQPLDGVDFSNNTGSYVNGVLTCTVERESVSNNSLFYNMTEEWFLISASGATYSSGVIPGHDVSHHFVSAAKINFSDYKDVSAPTPDYSLVKAHGCLMVIAWMFIASLGLSAARFCKAMWPDTKLCDVKIWFAVHRSAMVMVFVTGISSFIIIFVYVLGYSAISGKDFMKAHPILGIIVTSLLFINPFMSLLRCAPNHPRRPLFNLAHGLVGSSAHLLGGLTIAFGLYLPKANLNADKGLIIMVIYGSWYLAFFLVMSLLDIASKSRSSKGAAEAHGQPFPLADVQPPALDSKSSYNLNTAGSQNSFGDSGLNYASLDQSKEPPFSFIKKLLMLANVIVLFSLTVALLVLIISGDV